jgi:riboflavin kinase/FMN adenylyltransferase
LPREGFAIPDSGVYITETLIDGKLYGGITNIGNNPTFNLTKTTVETHLFDYCENLYGQSIEVFFIKRVRGEITFNSPEELSARVMQDIEDGKAFFGGRCD